MYGKSDRQPPLLFFLILICFGAILLTGGLRRWPYFLESGPLPLLLKRFLLLSSEETNNYIAAFCIIGGVIAIITGLLGLFILTK
jgi:hypothetical protein